MQKVCTHRKIEHRERRILTTEQSQRSNDETLFSATIFTTPKRKRTEKAARAERREQGLCLRVIFEPEEQQQHTHCLLVCFVAWQNGACQTHARKKQPSDSLLVSQVNQQKKPALASVAQLRLKRENTPLPTLTADSFYEI
jgi:hypothetical protein